MKQKIITVEDIRHDFRPVSAWLANGASVEITKRRRNFARLSAATAAPDKLVKVEFEAQLRAVWGEKLFTVAEVRTMRAAELGRRSLR